MNTKPNIENIDYCIELMRNAKNLDMEDWQDGSNGARVNSIEELHECGTAACFGGYVAASKKFQEDGGKVNQFDGSPAIYASEYHEAIASWLSIENNLAYELCFVKAEDKQFYGCERDEVTPEMVIEKLEMIKAGEL